MRVRFLPDGGLVLTNPDGTDYTNVKHGSLDSVYESVQFLIDDALAINFPNEIRVDGQIEQAGAQPPALFGSIPDGKLAGWFRHFDGPITPPITVPAVTPAKTVGGNWAVTLDSIPPSKQIQFYTSGVGAGGTITLDIPSAPGRVRGTEKAGTTTTTRHVKQTHDGALVMDQDTGTSLDGVRISNGPGRDLIVITMPGYDGSFGFCDMTLIVDYDKT
jgi:hypothetical protein